MRPVDEKTYGQYLDVSGGRPHCCKIITACQILLKSAKPFSPRRVEDFADKHIDQDRIAENKAAC